MKLFHEVIHFPAFSKCNFVATITQVHDVVVSVPTYFTDAERRALLDAARYRAHCVIVMVHDVVISVPIPHLPHSQMRSDGRC
jgi:hypothetical protein